MYIPQTYTNPLAQKKIKPMQAIWNCCIQRFYYKLE